MTVFTPQLLHGDCLDVLSSLPSDSIHMVFADVPYGITTHDYDSKIDLSLLWQQLKRIGIERCAHVFTSCQPFTLELMLSNRQQFRYDLIWHKGRPGGFLNAKRMPLRAHEHISLFYKKLPTYNPQMTDVGKLSPKQGKNRSRLDVPVKHGYGVHSGTTQVRTTMRYPTSIFKALSVPPNVIVHPAQKPVALLEWLILTYTNKGDTVLDPCAGSGVTAIAAMRTGRRSICIEKDPVYFEAMSKRVAAELDAPQVALDPQLPLATPTPSLPPVVPLPPTLVRISG